MTLTQLVWRVEIPSPEVRRLCRDFPDLSTETVRGCVRDVRLRARHLGVEPTLHIVEQVAREHLVGVVKSEPPSGRRAERGTDE